MSNKTYLQDRLAWLEWLDANELERDRLVSPVKFPCVAVLADIEVCIGGPGNQPFPVGGFEVVSYVFLDDFLPF